MESFTFINSKNKQVVFSTERSLLIEDNSSVSLWLQSFSGTSNTGIITPTSRGFNQNGYTLKNLNMGTRVVNLEFIVCGNTNGGSTGYSQIRKMICEILNPLLGNGTLIYYNGVNSYMLTCVVSAMPTEKKVYGFNMASMKVEFTAYNPLWRSLSPHTVRKSITSGNYVAYESFDGCRTFGDIPAPFTFKMKASPYRGYVRLEDNRTSTSIIRNNFEFRTTRDTNISYMELTTDYGNKNLWLATTGEKTLANRYITTPDFFTIPNDAALTLRFGLELASASASGDYAELTYYDWYVGV